MKVQRLAIACDRVGLAVTLRRPAVSVHAWIAGWPVTLRRPPGAAASRRGRTHRTFSGFLQPAGIVGHLRVRPDAGPRRWYGSGFPTPSTVRLRIDYGAGDVMVTRLRVQLNTGWS